MSSSIVGTRGQKMFLSLFLSLETIEMDQILRNPNLLATCRQLSLGGSSGMNMALDYYQQLILNRSVNAHGIFANYQKQCIGWALLTRESDSFHFKEAPGHACFQVFVHAQYRRNKIGSKLLEKAKSLVPGEELFCYAWSNNSFFLPMITQGVCRSL